MTSCTDWFILGVRGHQGHSLVASAKFSFSLRSDFSVVIQRGSRFYHAGSFSAQVETGDSQSSVAVHA